MVYIINNYDGSQLVGINDQTVNSTATSLRLPGRDYKPYGEVIVENLVWMLQNFRGETPPLRAVPGQIWYDSVSQVIKVYDQNNWLTVGKPLLGNIFPVSAQDGQLFYHTTKKQMFVWDLTNWKLLSPLGAQDLTDPVAGSQVTNTRWEALTVADTGATNHAILKLSVGGSCVAIFSADTFNTVLGAIPGFTPVAIQAGINLNSTLKFSGTVTLADVATNALSLGGVLAALHMRKDESNVPTSTGLSLGSVSTPYLNVHATNFVGNASTATLATNAVTATNATTADTATNATQLNGQNASYYLNASNLTTGTLDVLRLPYTPVNKAGDTNVGNLSLTGTLTLAGNPVSNMQAATKEYVDNNKLLVYQTAAFSVVNGGSYTFNHNFNKIPLFCSCDLVCVIAEGGYNTNDILELGAQAGESSTDDGITIRKTITQLFVNVGSSGFGDIIQAGGGGFAPNTANWQLIVKAFG